MKVEKIDIEMRRKVKKDNKKNKSITYLFILIIITALLVIGSFSKYTYSMGEEKTVEVAKFIANSDMEEVVQNFELTGLYPGCEDKVIQFSVANNSNNNVSEVDIGYNFSIKNTGNLPLTFNIEVDDENTSSTGTTATQKDQDNELFWDGGVLPTSTNSTHTYKVTVSWNEAENNVDYSEEIDMLMVAVNFEQID